MAPFRIVLAAAMVLGGAALIWLLATRAADAPGGASFEPAFELLGAGTKAFDRALSRAVPVNELDEKEFGDAIARRYGAGPGASDTDLHYVNGVLGVLARRASRPFTYRAFMMSSAAPNAFALPGGVILVTRGLPGMLSSESELAAILAHEMGHIERGHCFDAVRFELLARKTGATPLGRLADFAANLMLCALDYDPGGVPDAFASFIRYAAGRGEAPGPALNPVRDYFSTHPAMERRRDRYAARAKLWLDEHPGERRYRGVRNLAERKAFPGNDFPGEWMIVPRAD